MNEPLVISLGGAVIVPKSINTQYLRRFIQFVRRLSRSRRVIVVIGGGATARAYLESARKAGARLPNALHWVGVRACQLNAELVRAVLHVNGPVLTDPEAVSQSRARIIVAAPPSAGGTSDFRTVIVARRVHAKTVYNVTNVDGVYTADPRKVKNARLLPRLSWSFFINMFGTTVRPGMHAPFDPAASRLAERSGIRVVVVGPDLRNLRQAIANRAFRGTVIG